VVTKATVCYDKANNEVFRELSLEDKHLFFASNEEFTGKNDLHTLFTTQNDMEVEGKQFDFTENRPILLLTSTTYTEDEVVTYDQKIEYLFNSMIRYEKHCSHQDVLAKKPRHLMLVCTGSGERKKIYQEMIEENRYKWKYISIVMKWFKPDDYPKMVACADVGICLHYSSSGFDLPMKVVDMFGTGLPAIAADYQTYHLFTQNRRARARRPDRQTLQDRRRPLQHHQRHRHQLGSVRAGLDCHEEERAQLQATDVQR